MIKQIITAIMMVSMVNVAYAAPTANEGETCATTYTDHSNEGLSQLNDYAQCWINEFRADEESGSLLGHKWVRINGEIYSIPEAELKKAYDQADAISIFKEHIGQQISFPIEVALETANEAQQDYNKLVAEGATEELARTIVEVKFPGVVFIDREVIKTIEVEVPVKVIKEVEVIVEVPVEVIKEVEVIVEVPGETIIKEVEVIVEVPGETIIKEVEVIVTETVIVYKDGEVITVEVPVETIVEVKDPEAYDDGFLAGVASVIAEDGITSADVEAVRSELQGQIDKLAAERTVLKENAVANAEQIAELQTQINTLTLERDNLTIEKAAAFAAGVASVPETVITYGDMVIPVVSDTLKAYAFAERLAANEPKTNQEAADLIAEIDAATRLSSVYTNSITVGQEVWDQEKLALGQYYWLGYQAATTGVIQYTTPTGNTYQAEYAAVTEVTDTQNVVAQTASLVANVVAQQAFQTGFVEGLVVGYGNGYDQGYDDGYNDGYRDGFIAGVASVTIN